MPIDFKEEEKKKKEFEKLSKKSEEEEIRVSSERREKIASFLRKNNGKAFSVVEIVRACGPRPTTWLYPNSETISSDFEYGWLTKILLDCMAGDVEPEDEEYNSARHNNIFKLKNRFPVHYYWKD
jgi:hypothetical protein